MVTSGTQTPFLKKAIGMAYVPVGHAAPAPRSRSTSAAAAPKARVVPLPFYKRPPRKLSDDVSDRLSSTRRTTSGSASDRRRGQVGITDFAQEQLGDVVYVELPEVGPPLTQGQSFGTIESVKAVSELFAPVSGEVVEVNPALKDKPELVNREPHDTWMVAIKLANPAEAGRAARRRRLRRAW